LKLHFAHTSPFARKVMACAIARGIENRIELIVTNPHESPPALLKANPLSKVPCLITDSGEAVYDSPVICEYLDTIGEANALFPTSGTHRWIRISVMHALADGIMDAAFTRRMQGSAPQDEARSTLLARQKAAIERGLDVLEAGPPVGLDDIGGIAVGCALGYLDFRFGHEPWRPTRPKLAAWYAEASRQPPLALTAPPPA
jgi:glutathione S-transferase